jgi:hypothetical protein
MKNANLVAKYDDMDMNLREQRETIVNQNALYGLSVTVIDAWDCTGETENCFWIKTTALCWAGEFGKESISFLL